MSIGQQNKLGLFEHRAECVELALQDGQIAYFSQAFDEQEADVYWQHCIDSLAWRQDSIRIANKQILIPRLQCWYGDTGTDYRYSGLTLTPLPWPPFLLQIKQRVESLCQHRFNAVLANYYRDGRDSVDWHSDDEAELGVEPVIASLSLGAVRRFEMKHRYNKALRPSNIQLAHGSLLLMKGKTQQYWRHRLPKDVSIAAPRINLTFRMIRSLAA